MKPIEFIKDLHEAHPNSKIYDKCWDGYRKVPGKKRGEKGSCVKEDDVNVVDRGEYDREGEMAQSQARTIEDAAQELQSILDADENLPEWVQKKITLAMDYIDTARDYLKSNRPEDDTEMALPEDAGSFSQEDYDKIARKKRHLMMLNRNLEPEDAEEMAAAKLGYDYDAVLAWVDADHDDVKEEETYEGDAFYEAYGELWFNEDEQLDEAEYQGRKVSLGKPMRGDVKKFKVYVKDPKTGNVKKVNFGDPDMKIRKSNPKARKSFRARHNCANPGPRTKARYWSCRKW